MSESDITPLSEAEFKTFFKKEHTFGWEAVSNAKIKDGLEACIKRALTPFLGRMLKPELVDRAQLELNIQIEEYMRANNPTFAVHKATVNLKGNGLDVDLQLRDDGVELANLLDLPEWLLIEMGSMVRIEDMDRGLLPEMSLGTIR